MSLAEKEQHLDEKNSIIEKLQSELNILKQSPNAETNDTNISMFVEQVISNAIQEIKEEDQVSSISRTEEEAIPMDCKQNNLSIEKKDSWTTMTPTAVKTHSATSMTPVQKADAMLATTPIPVKDTMTSPTHTTTTSPIYRIDTTTSFASGTPGEHVITVVRRKAGMAWVTLLPKGPNNVQFSTSSAPHFILKMYIISA